MATRNKTFNLIIPDHRYLAVEKAIELSLEDGEIKKTFTTEMNVLYALLVEQAQHDGIVVPQNPTSTKGYTLLALSIYEDDVQSAILESLLLTEAELKTISDTFNIPLIVLHIYEKLFFDKVSFNTKLCVLSYIDDLEEGIHKELKRRAYSHGSDFVLYKYGNVLPDTEGQRKLLKKLFLDSAYRAMEANFAPATSASGKVALEWAKVMMKASESIERIFSNTGPTTDTLMIHLVTAQEAKEAKEAKEVNLAVSDTTLIVDPKDII